jgi:hypothetical protein
MLANRLPDVALFRYTWLLFILVTCLNGAMWWFRGKPYMAAKPELESGYRRMIRVWLIFGNLPWAVMGAGIVFGAVRSIFDYWNPRNGPYVIFFYFTIVILWFLGYRWLFFEGGAEDLAAHPGLMNGPQTPRAIKMLSLAMLAGGIAGLSMMVFGNIRLPQ